jgi:hypothetical protein
VNFVGPDQPGLESSVGLKIDATRRRLWVCTGRYVLFGGPHTSDPRTGVLLFDLDDGQLLQSWLIDEPTPGHIFNDLAVMPDGSVYATTTLFGRVYHVVPGAEAMELVVESAGMQTNGITLGPEVRYLFFTFDRAIRRLDLRTGVPTDVAIPGGQGIGTDGLYLHDGSLVAVQPRRRRIVTLQLNQGLDTVVNVSLLAGDHPDFAYPTTGVMVRDTLFLVATSFADRPRTDGQGPQHPDVLIQAWPLGTTAPALEPIAKIPLRRLDHRRDRGRGRTPRRTTGGSGHPGLAGARVLPAGSPGGDARREKARGRRRSASAGRWRRDPQMRSR